MAIHSILLAATALVAFFAAYNALHYVLFFLAAHPKDARRIGAALNEFEQRQLVEWRPTATDFLKHDDENRSYDDVSGAYRGEQDNYSTCVFPRALFTHPYSAVPRQAPAPPPTGSENGRYVVYALRRVPAGRDRPSAAARARCRRAGSGRPVLPDHAACGYPLRDLWHRAPVAFRVRVWHLMSRGRGLSTERPLPEGVRVVYPLTTIAVQPLLVEELGASAGSSVRSRMTCQRIEGSESSSHCRTDVPWVAIRRFFVSLVKRWCWWLTSAWAAPCINQNIFTARSIRGQTSFAVSSMERRASAGSVQSWPV